MKFTPEQEQVIQLHNRNILVSAAAGSGKTAVLVERIVRMVCDEAHPVDIDRLLIVTFTNAAAAEMRERIAAGIAAKLRERPESEHIQRQAALLHNAQITTIDSFCLFIIRNHFHEIGLDPAFRVADESEVKLLEQEVLAALLEESYAEGREAFLHCVEFFCPGGRESVLENHLLSLSHHAASCPFPEEWLNARRQDYGAETAAEFFAGGAGQYLKCYVDAMLDGCIEKLLEVRRLCDSPDGPYLYGALVEQELEALEALRRQDSLAEYSVRIPALVFGRLPVKKDESVSHLKRERAKALRAQVKDILQDMGKVFFQTPAELAAAQSKACESAVNTLIDLTLEFDRRMRQCKLERKIIDFSDMEHYALEILLERDGEEIKPGRVAREYAQYFREILIDEYQDSNLVQEYLLKAVSGEGEGRFNRFMVGDVKQSIYRFRLARPELFLEKYDSYETDGDACCRIDLSRNFRSRPQVVDTVNSVFGRLMSRRTGGIDYDERAALYAGAEYPETSAAEGSEADDPKLCGIEAQSYGSELLLVEKPDRGEEKNARQAEALAVARRIKELRQSFRVLDKESGKLRPVSYSDMVILLRAPQGWDEEFKAVLEQEGVPVHITARTGYFAATEVQELLQVLRVLDNPRQDIPLYGMLKSVFGGFTEEEIAGIRAGKRNCTLYEALCGWEREETDAAGEGETGSSATEAVGTGGSEALRERIRTFLERLRRYREYTVYMPIRELLCRLVEDHDYLNYVAALPAGGKRRANVEMLFTKASDFEKSSYFGLFHFVRYMEQLEKYDVDYGEADLLDEHADVVRIMSIHKSKGLEFPVTFVAGLSKRFSVQDYSRALIMDMDMGLGVAYVDPERRIRNKTLRQKVIAEKLREENLAEELRVLYVAMTRAREKLILSASLENAQEKWDAAREYAEPSLCYPDYIGAGSDLDFLMPILAGTDLQVKIVGKEELEAGAVREQIRSVGRLEALAHAAEYADALQTQTLRKRLAFVYPYESLERLYTKTTVSELKIAAMAEKDEAAFHAFEEREVVPYIPSFRREKEQVSGAVRGNAFHRAMELLDFERLLGGRFAGLSQGVESDAALDRTEPAAEWTEESSAELSAALEAFLREETLQKRLSEEYRNALNLRKIVRFLESDLGYRMWAAQTRGKLYREQPFVLGIDAKRLSEEFPEAETVLIQGIIDVFWEEDGELVLLDYKTDVVHSMEELWNRYEVQLSYYQEALEKLTGMPVKESILYSFYLETGER
ncbi:MAG: helicase-exonuclease AddAB subunit AddA [Muribaculum sp.]|nr:helicase-exonuclease AddAB subunit AddA [Muribaculum sp.]